MASKANAVSAPAKPVASRTVYLPLCRDERGWFVAGRNPYGCETESAADGVCKKTGGESFVVEVEVPA